jgi:hypothetical protein
VKLCLYIYIYIYIYIYMYGLNLNEIYFKGFVTRVTGCWVPFTQLTCLFLGFWMWLDIISHSLCSDVETVALGMWILELVVSAEPQSLQVMLCNRRISILTLLLLACKCHPYAENTLS